MENLTKERIYYIDWLRIFAILVVFIFHCAHIFDPMDFHVKNKETSEIFMIFVLFCIIWMMPLFFLLAGASSQFAANVRTPRQFISERFKRLIIPLILGVMVIVPPQFYVEALQKGYFTGNYVAYLGRHFEIFTKHWQFNPVYFGSIGHHVWFLAFLFIFSVLTLPVFKFLQGANGQKFIDKLAMFCNKPGMIYIFALPPTVIYLILKPVSPMYNDWADFFNWILVFISGYIIYSRNEFLQAIVKHTYPALVTAIISFGTCVGLMASGSALEWYERPDYSFGCMFFYILWVINSWSWIFFFLGIGTKFLNLKNKLLSYASEAVLPFYLLHQTIILLVGYVVVQWNAGMFIKFIVVTIGSLILTVGLYEFLVRRLPFMRYIFGMKPLKRSNAVGTGMSQ